MTENNIDQLDEFQADHSDSAIADPVDTGGNNRPADKANAEAPASHDSDGVTVRSREGMIGQTISDLKNAPAELVQSIFDQVRNWEGNGPERNARPADKMGNGDKATKALSREAVEAIFGETDQDLSEEFLDRAALVFETSINLRADEVRGTIAEEYETKLAEAVEANLNEVAKTVGDFLDVVSAAWLEENKIAIASNIKLEIAEDLFKGMKTMLEAYNVEISDEKVDVVENMESDVASANEKLEEATATIDSLNKELDGFRVAAVFADVSEGMVTTDEEKFRKLAEAIDYSDVDDYREKLNTIKEAYFRDATKVVSESSSDDGTDDALETGEEEPKPSPNDPMARYTDAIRRTVAA